MEIRVISVNFKSINLATKSKFKNLSDIIKDIRTGKYTSKISKIRLALENGDDKQKTKLKDRLPSFIAAVRLDENVNKIQDSQNVEATGIIQWDIDHINDHVKATALISRLIDKPYILYAFISPSNNVKFAVLTDFVCDDKADISQKYQIGYRLISDDPKFQDMLSGYELDGSADRVSQACYISDDPAAYFNQDCKPLDNLNGMITDKFDDLAGEAVALQIEIDKDNKNKKDLYTNTDEDVLECLESFTSNPVKYQGKFYVWDYNNRSKINFAVINHFGPDAENILVAHWLRIGIDTDEPKLRQQIQDHIESDAYKKHSGENTIKVATLF